MSHIVRMRILVGGRVQKVFFRHTTRKIAHALGLSGWVKNEGEDVLCEAQGERVMTEQFVLFMMRGPRLSRVKKISVEFIEPIPDEKGFQITG